ncbi:TlpA family protein disulfide reductase [Paenibacillus sambharensis]|uniref:TlpA family protein disulfide reductase n=1 Tax=Paenibacillus sambharensis TaxID=1803190 RepID=A0A2W1LNC0_9BACL|nr:TlpA disulfide reductase family protein [Paenibacillus sambharensis]PZD95964.1 TlpA family protein disulfide reductase [Paenibacillus sambharensis]
MNRSRVWLICAIAILLAGFAVYMETDEEPVVSAGPVSGEAKPKVGYTAPVFELPDLNDQAIRVGGTGDKLVLINFWASWCGPCVMEAPDLQELHEAYGDKVTIVGVNATKFDREREARQFVDEYEFTFPVLMDRKGMVTELYRVSEFPTSLLVDRMGIVRERVTGVIPSSKWRTLIDKWS